MPKTLNAIVLGVVLMGTTAPAALSFEFGPAINQCIIDMHQDCFDTLFDEFSARVAALEDTTLRDGYAAVPTAILLKAGMTNRAENTARKINDPAKRMELLAHVGNSYARGGQVEEAYRLLAEIELPYARSLLITEIALIELIDGDITSKLPGLIDLMVPDFVDSTFAEIALGLVKAGQLHKATEIAPLIFDAQQQAHAFGHIARAFAKAGDVAMASAQLDLIRDPDFQILARGEVGLTLHEDGNVLEAKRIYDKAATFAIELSADDPAKNERLERIAYYLIKSGYSDDALSLIALVQKSEVKAALFYQLGQAYLSRGDTEQALDHLQRAVLATTRDLDHYKYYATLRETAVTFAKAGDVDTALAVAERLQEINLVSAAVKAIGDVVLKAGDDVRAQNIYASITHLDIRVAALVEFSKRLDQEGQNEQATRILSGLETMLVATPVQPDAYQDGNHLRGSSFASVSRAYVDRGALRAGLRLALAIEDTDQRLWTVIPILGAAIDASDDMLADEISNMLFSELQSHPRPGNVQSVLAFLTTLPQNLENIDSHKRYATLLTDDVSKTLLYNAVFENLTANEKYVAANEVLNLMPDASLKQVAIIELLKRRIEQITQNH